MIRRLAWLLAASLSLGFAAPALADNNPDRKWTVLETEHFLVHYYPGEERTARRIAESAEDVLPAIAKDFGVEVKDKIPIILDHGVFFNGQAEPIKDRIYLDPMLASSSVIGSKRFIAHELTHVITFLALSRDTTLSKLSNLAVMPTWFLEGIAQYEGEFWSATNDRMLRLHALDDSLLTNSEREHFTLLGSEFGASGYNEGYSLTSYLFETYGRDKIAKLFKLFREGQETNLARAISRLTGQNLDAIQAAWANKLKEQYHKQTLNLKESLPGSRTILPSTRGEANVQPRMSPDGSRLAYLTSRHQDSFLYLRGHVMGFLSLTIADPDGKNPVEIPMGKGRTSAFCWSPDGKEVVMAAASQNEEGDPTFNLFISDAGGKNGKQLTKIGAATDPAWRPGTKEVAFVHTRDGRAFLKKINVTSGKIDDIALDLGDRQLANLTWSPDGKRLAATSFLPGDGGKLVVIDPAARTMTPLTEGPAQVADSEPTWTPDGKAIVFSSSRGGMENLYKLTLTGAGGLGSGQEPPPGPDRLTRLTNIYTGARNPAVAPDGKSLLWSSFRSSGSEVRSAPFPAGMPEDYQAPTALPTVYGGTKIASQVAAGPAWTEHPYSAKMTNDMIIPQVTSDERGQQLGVMALYSDILDKQQLGLDLRFGLMSQRFSYSANYVNRMLPHTWGLSLFDAPTVGIPDSIDPDKLSQSLYWERQRGLRGKVQLGQFMLGTTFSYVTALTQPTEASGRIREGRLNSVALGWGEQNVAPTVDSDINPSAGYSVGTQFTLSDRAVGSEFNFSTVSLGYERYFPIIPDWRHNLTLSAAVGLSQGDAPPFFVGGAIGGGPLTALRGYHVGQSIGNRVAYLGAEYAFPIQSHLDFQFGPLYFDKLYGAAFAEAADAWQQGAVMKPSSSVGAEMRLRLALAGRQVVVLRLGAAHPLLGAATDFMPYIAF